MSYERSWGLERKGLGRVCSGARRAYSSAQVNVGSQRRSSGPRAPCRRASLLGLLAASVSTVCGQQAGDEPSSSTYDTTAAASVSATVVATGSPLPRVVAPAIPGSGEAWFLIAGRGLVRAHDGKLDILAKERVWHLAEGADGKPYVEVDRKIVRVDGDTLHEVAARAPARWTVSPRGELWAVDDKKLTLEGAPIARPKGSTITDFAVEASGRLVAITVLSSVSLEAWTSGAWRTLPLPEQATVTRLGVSHGVAYVGTTRGLWRLTGDVLEPVPGPRPVDAGQNTVWRVGTSRGSSVAYVVDRNHVIRVDEGGAFVDWALGADVGSETVDELAVDARGRVWAGTASRLIVLGPGASDKIVLPSGAHDALAGGIDALVVAGDGPAIEASATLLMGAVKGVLQLADGAPVAGVPLDLCPRFDVYATPFCGTALYQAHATTASDGSFVFEGIPLGSYNLNVRRDDLRLLMIGVVGMRAGEALDLGTRKLTPP